MKKVVSFLSAVSILLLISLTSWAAGGLTITAGSVSLSNGSTLDIDGGITIDQVEVSSVSGTLDAGDGTIKLTGDWTNSGTFTCGTSTVTLDGTDQVVSGSSTFYDLTKLVPSACTLTFEAGSTQTITNTLTMTGVGSETGVDPDKMLTIRSTVADTQATLDIPSNITSGVDYVDVKDNEINGEGHTIDPGDNSVDSGNNTNWLFPTVVSITDWRELY
ncbi:hypothetical protein KAT51_06415 [bacterium]|nr:hypothetical protein [bacterium]